MEQDQNGLEEGELEDEEETVYVPLKRPETYALDIPQKRFPEQERSGYSDSEEEIKFSESDSDSDTATPAKKEKKRVKLIPKPRKQRTERLKKYDIWSTRAQEDVLAETMINCDVTLKDRSRQCESYDFSLARSHFEESGRHGNKRTREDMKNFNFKPKKKQEEEKEFKGKPREIADLNTNENNSIEDIAKDVANKLSEQRDDLILKVLEVLGKKKTIEIFQETQVIEKEGGMPILNQTRRRTPGGIFLYLVRNDYYITPDQRSQIFYEEKQKQHKISKEKKKKKLQDLKAFKNLERTEILPELLTRAELFAKENSQRKLKETDEANCTNPPPSPETDHHESGDGMDPSSAMELRPLPTESNVSNDNLNSSTDSRGKLKIYDDDFLDITLETEMDLF